MATAWGALWGLRRVHDPEERRVLGSIGAAFLCWLAALLTAAPAPGSVNPRTVEVISDVFFLGSYLPLLLLVEHQPHLGAAVGLIEVDRRLKSIGVICLVCGWFAYFVLIPAVLDQPFYQSAMPSYYFYLTLDAFLIVRCVTFSRSCESRRWRTMYLWLAAAAFLNGLVDVVETLTAIDVLRWRDGDLTDFLWVSPMLAFLMMARLRRDPEPGEEPAASIDVAESRALDPIRSGNLLVAWAFSFPLVHLWLYSAGILKSNLERAHSVLVLVELSAMGTLAVAAYLALARAHREVERQRAAAVARIREAQRMEAVGRLAGGVAHDFNNLLMAMTGYNDIAIAALDPDDPNRPLLEEVSKAAGRAGSLTRQLLAFSRRQVLQPERLDLNAIVSRLDPMLRRLIGEDIALITRLEPDLGLVMADPGQMESLIVHLAGNARDAMPNGGTLVIATGNVKDTRRGLQPGVTARQGGQVQLVVGDSGVGIPRHVLPHIFEPFFSTKTREKSAGLGLATIHGFITQSGGTIQAASAPGHGTTFTVRLPRSENDGAGAARPTADPSRANLETITVATGDSVRSGRG